MNIVIEKERKWLMKGWFPEWDSFTKRRIYIEQFYNKDGWRYRMEVDDQTEETKYYRLKKITIEKGINHEVGFEEITSTEYHRVFNENKNLPIITKHRHIFEYDGRLLELDVFCNIQLVILEIENVDINDKIEFPEFMKSAIIMEVTDFPYFSNKNLAI